MSETYVECLVKKKTSIVMVMIKWILTAAAAFCIMLGLLGIILLLIAGILLGVLAYFVNMRSVVEYEYLYLDKEITVDRILNKTKRKRMGTFDVDRMEIFAPIKSHQLDSYRNRQMKTLDYSVGEERQPDMRYVMYCDGNSKVILSPSPEMIKALRTVAPRKVFMD